MNKYKVIRILMLIVIFTLIFNINLNENVEAASSLIEYEFGDIDKDGNVDAVDAALALDIYKYGGATADEIELGDMDGNEIIDATDAALILDTYKYGTIYPLGDLNKSLTADEEDIEVLQNYLNGTQSLTLALQKYGDVDENGVIDEIDLVYLTNYIAWEKGDLNADGSIDFDDYYILVDYLNGDVELSEIVADLADTNGDGEISENDATLLYSYLTETNIGDIVGNGLVRMYDANLVIAYYQITIMEEGQHTEEEILAVRLTNIQLKQADYNGDGEVTLVDGFAILKVAMNS